MAIWLRSFQLHVSRWDLELNPKAQQVIRDDALNGVAPSRKNFHVRVQEIETFVITNKRLPKESSKGVEGSLAGWYFKSKRRIEEVRDLLSTKAREILFSEENERLKKAATVQLEELSNFIVNTLRLPSGSNAVGNERQLAQFLIAYRNSVGRGVVISELSINAQKIVEEKQLFGEYKQSVSDRIAEIDKFIKENLRIPSVESSLINEAHLGNWLATYRRRVGRGNVLAQFSNETQKIIEDRQLLGESKRAVSEWLTELDKYIREHHRLPSKTSSDGSEARLGTWLDGYRSSVGRGNISSEVSTEAQIIIDSKRLFGEPRRLNSEWLSEVDIFIKQHLRLPSDLASDLQEAKIGKWFVSYRDSKGTSDWLAQASPDVREIVSSRKLIPERKSREERMVELNAFILEYLRPPIFKASGSSAEASLSGWFTASKTEQNQIIKDLSPEARLALETYKKAKSQKSTKFRVAQLDEFILQNKRLPLRSGASEKEASLADWLEKHRSSVVGNQWPALLSVETQRIVTEKNLVVKPKTNQDWIMELETFILKNKRMPRRKKDKSTEEKLAYWIYRYRTVVDEDWMTKLSPKANSIISGD